MKTPEAPPPTNGPPPQQAPAFTPDIDVLDSPAAIAIAAAAINSNSTRPAAPEVVPVSESKGVPMVGQGSDRIDVATNMTGGVAMTVSTSDVDIRQQAQDSSGVNSSGASSGFDFGRGSEGDGGSYPLPSSSSDVAAPITADNMANLALSAFNSSKKVALDDFVLLKVIGKGSYGMYCKVMLVRHKTDGCIYAMKMLRKENIVKRNQVEHTKTERNVLEYISHPFIVRLVCAFQTVKKLYFVLEYCPGGELFFHLSRAGRFTEQRARFYSAEIILALEHLHKMDIVYRDLKPENVLLDEEGHIRLTDFGLSKEGIQDNTSARSLCGTPEYLAPEILNQTGHGKAVDWWSLGALIYEMLTGLPPFYTRDREKLFENIRAGDLRYPSFISPVAKSLLQGLFQRDPNRRLGGGNTDADEIKCHPFYASVDWDALLQRRITPPFRPSLASKTDVQYFDKEFVSLPVINSEVPDSALTHAMQQDDNHFEGFTYDPNRHKSELHQAIAEEG
ncbi:unnamed protein product [Vitrella brassicaformis CCMP3155]|uniref:Non-specific serine/threonine protein kinase n=1 Tax=Vitrella brassicaformis (strain CCMP3155) TaxID=1169540 RepID=A0A0G4GQR2_VITBC|nr:unnamed protein product [Vitrella brassicaformis CCMP3155]|eukprot:CEM32786.1 unnamed protein product [Vitrella brassicaformis CCMP3155]